MAKYHINAETGKVGRCAATVRDCPVGVEGLHFDSLDSASSFSSLFERNQVQKIDGIVPAAIQERDEQVMKQLLTAGDWRGLKELVKERSNAPEFVEAIARRDELSEKMAEMKEKLDELQRKNKLVNQDVALPAAIELRELTLEYRDLYEEFAYNRQLLTEYRVLSAKAALASSTLRENQERANGVFLSYDEKQLGDLVAMGEYPSGSPEWHAARAAGIGGSDVGGIMRVDPDYGSVNYQRVVAAKLGEELPDAVQEDPDAGKDFTTAVGRGNAWEEYIRYEVQDRNPDMNVAFCKTSWHGKGDLAYRHANFDGLFLDDNGKPEGILEIKTGSNAKKWGDPEKDGFAGVPEGYRKQALWYAANGGLKYGKIVAVIDDNDYREYNFSMSDPAIQAEVKEIYEATDGFWKTIQEKKAAVESGLSTPHRKHNGLGPNVSIDSVAKLYSSYSGESVKTAKAKLAKELNAARGPEKKELSRQQFQSVVYKVFGSHDPSSRKKPLVGIDLETTSTSPRTGRIIETGIVNLDSNGNAEIVYNELHGMPDKAMRGVGVGMTDVHGITPERVAGKTPFDDPEVQKAVLDKLKNSTLVAHNAGFEDRFLSANLPGYVEAKSRGEIDILDTRLVAKTLMPRSEDNSLKSFAEDNGVPYEGAHAAATDSLMMMKGLHRLQRTMFDRGGFITKRPTFRVRDEAQQNAQYLEDQR